MKHLILALILLATPASAERACGPSVFILHQLSMFGETIREQSTRPSPSGNVDWILWVNEKTGSWTLTGTQGAVTCAFAWGRDGYDGQVIDDFLAGVSL